MNRFLEILKVAPHQIINNIEIQYHQRIKERWGESIFKNSIKTEDVTFNRDEPDAGEIHKKIAT